MRKLLSFILMFGMLVGLPACSAEEPFDEAVFMEEIQPNLECLDSCALEMFGAEVDFDTEYFALYENETVWANGEADVFLLVTLKEAQQQSNYFLDPTYASYHPVLNFKTNAEVRQGLQEYLSDTVIDQWFRDDFLEYNGALYLRRGARGYGAMSCDKSSAKYLEEKEDGKQYVSMDVLYFDEYDHTAMLVFEPKKDGEGWLLTETIDMDVRFAE